MQAMIDELAKQAAESLGQVSGKETLASFWQEYQRLAVYLESKVMFR